MARPRVHLTRVAPASPRASRRAERHPSRARRIASASASASASSSPSLLFATSAALEHVQLGHPESNARVPAILDALEAGALTPAARPGEVLEITDVVPATKKALERVHAKNYCNGAYQTKRARRLFFRLLRAIDHLIHQSRRRTDA